MDFAQIIQQETLDVIHQYLSQLDSTELNELYRVIRTESLDNLQLYELFMDLGYNIHLVHENSTFFKDAQKAMGRFILLHRESDVLPFIFKLLAKGYNIRDTPLAISDGHLMMEWIINYGTFDQLNEILQFQPHLDGSVLFYTIQYRPEMVGPLIEAGAPIAVLNEEGDDPLTYAIKCFNDFGTRTSLEIPPLTLNTTKEIIDFLEMTDCQYELFQEYPYNFSHRIEVCSIIKGYLDSPLIEEPEN